MEPEGSSPHSHAPATCLYPEPAQSSPFSLSCGMKLPPEALPPGDPSGGVVYLRIFLSPEEASRP